VTRADRRAGADLSPRPPARGGRHALGAARAWPRARGWRGWRGWRGSRGWRGWRGWRRAQQRAAARPTFAILAAFGLAAFIIAAGGLVIASHGARQATPLGATPFVPIPYGHADRLPDPSDPVQAAAPVALIIPAIGVRTTLIRLGRAASGALQVPATTSVAGWYTGSPRPGDLGAAVIAGHVDSYAGPGVFFRLRLLRPGDLIFVRRADGSLAAFGVFAVQTQAKARFPTAAVYGPTPAAELRLITCGGTFDAATGHYLSNVIVFAIAVPWTRPVGSPAGARFAGRLSVWRQSRV
jgi:hypothetical protein